MRIKALMGANSEIFQAMQTKYKMYSHSGSQLSQKQSRIPSAKEGIVCGQYKLYYKFHKSCYKSQVGEFPKAIKGAKHRSGLVHKVLKGRSESR